MVANYRRFEICVDSIARCEQHHSSRLLRCSADQREIGGVKKVDWPPPSVIVHELLVRLMDAIATLAASPDRDSFDTARNSTRP